MSAIDCPAVMSEYYIGDPDSFASDMGKLVNTKEYRLVAEGLAS